MLILIVVVAVGVVLGAASWLANRRAKKHGHVPRSGAAVFRDLRKAETDGYVVDATLGALPRNTDRDH